MQSPCFYDRVVMIVTLLEVPRVASVLERSSRLHFTSHLKGLLMTCMPLSLDVFNPYVSRMTVFCMTSSQCLQKTVADEMLVTSDGSPAWLSH